MFKVMQTYKIEPDHYLKVLNHNLNTINSLENGDIVKMEGFKVLNTFVLYHHTALLTGIYHLEFWFNGLTFKYKNINAWVNTG